VYITNRREIQKDYLRKKEKGREGREEGKPKLTLNPLK
jgi:hypothetical protein